MPDDLDRLAERYLRVARQVRRRTLAQIRPLGLSPHLSRALRIIGERGPLRPSELAERLAIAPRSASESIATLIEDGWIDRSPDPADGRAYRVTLTASGQQLTERVREIRLRVARELFGELSSRERAQLDDILRRLDTESP